MTDQQTLSVEATKLIKEWSAWMVAVQSGLIAFLPTIATSPNLCNAALMRIAFVKFWHLNSCRGLGSQYSALRTHPTNQV
jgi:hypothetical protein